MYKKLLYTLHHTKRRILNEMEIAGVLKLKYTRDREKGIFCPKLGIAIVDNGDRIKEHYLLQMFCIL